jgi:hypothetical protein
MLELACSATAEVYVEKLGLQRRVNPKAAVSLAFGDPGGRTTVGKVPPLRPVMCGWLVEWVKDTGPKNQRVHLGLGGSSPPPSAPYNWPYLTG